MLATEPTEGTTPANIPRGRRTPERIALAQQMKQEYETGASIRQLCATYGRSYGWVHDSLSIAGVSLRPRGYGPHTGGGKATPERTTRPPRRTTPRPRPRPKPRRTAPMPDTTTPPVPAAAPVNPALDAARALGAQGRHVHYVSDGQTQCLGGCCTNDTAKEN